MRFSKKRTSDFLMGLIFVFSLFSTACKNLAPSHETEEPSTESSVSSVEGKIDLLILVNKNNKLPDDYNPEIKSEGADFAVVLHDDFQDMRQAAKEENVYLFIRDAYRTQAEQKALFNELGESLAAPPGYSEHQTGLAIDFSIASSDVESAKTWDWLSKNAHNFGFILRYPKGKENITGYDFEPWHYRYVGKEHSKKIFEKGMVLEEYLAAS